MSLGRQVMWHGTEIIAQREGEDEIQPESTESQNKAFIIESRRRGAGIFFWKS